jgi:WD40 repeat protein
MILFYWNLNALLMTGLEKVLNYGFWENFQTLKMRQDLKKALKQKISLHKFFRSQILQPKNSLNLKFVTFQAIPNHFQLWDLRTQRPIHNFCGNDSPVRSAIFLPQQVTWKKLIASVSEDYRVFVWDKDQGGESLFDIKNVETQ